MYMICLYIIFVHRSSAFSATAVFYDSIRLVFLFPIILCVSEPRRWCVSSRPQPDIIIYSWGGHKNLSHRWKAIILDEDNIQHYLLLWYLTDSCLIFTSFKRYTLLHYIRAPSGRIVGVCNWSRCIFVHLSGFIHLCVKILYIPYLYDEYNIISSFACIRKYYKLFFGGVIN